jgi:chemotaxis signal transduction protein
VIVARCQNGVVLFRISEIKEVDGLEWRCLNDDSVGQQPRTGGGLEQFIRDMAAKAVTLRGTVLQVIELSEIV